MGVGSSKPQYIVKASRTECTYDSSNGKWACDTVSVNRNNTKKKNAAKNTTNTKKSKKPKKSKNSKKPKNSKK